MSLTYLSANELAERIHYKPETIMKKMVDCILFEGIHYVRPLGGRKKLFIWENI